MSFETDIKNLIIKYGTSEREEDQVKILIKESGAPDDVKAKLYNFLVETNTNSIVEYYMEVYSKAGQKEINRYLNNLMNSGTTDVFYAGQYLAKDFNIPIAIANGYVKAWVELSK